MVSVNVMIAWYVQRNFSNEETHLLGNPKVLALQMSQTNYSLDQVFIKLREHGWRKITNIIYAIVPST